MPIAIYLEKGTKRVFAGAVDWPGWARSAKDDDSAIQALIEYGARYSSAIARSRHGFKTPASRAELKVVERLKGNATTDFGVPGVAPKDDRRPLGEADVKRLGSLLKACWTAFDASAEAAVGAELSKGPRGGGRELDAIVSHVFEADRAYLSKLGGSFRAADHGEGMNGLRERFLEALSLRARGKPIPNASRARTLWTPRYAVRRSAWHALDHAWEIEDRAR